METLRGLKGTEREAGDSPPSSVELTKERSCIFTPPYAFIACKKKKTGKTLHMPQKKRSQ